MKLFVRLFTIVLIAFTMTMLYDWYVNPIEILEEGRTTSRSKYSEKIVSAPMRKVRQGWREFWQVKVPGGGWYKCRNEDCPETLRIEHVDHAFSRPESPEVSISPFTEER
ncbi:MAG: hypothetical protein GY927_03735 [bacterium]|nr:hypothetical protein [bacterium]